MIDGAEDVGPAQRATTSEIKPHWMNAIPEKEKEKKKKPKKRKALFLLQEKRFSGFSVGIVGRFSAAPIQRIYISKKISFPNKFDENLLIVIGR